MRIRSLTPLALIIGATMGGQAQASSDDSCYPNWSLLRDSLDVCNNLPFLTPGNDSRVNLRLLLADQKALTLQPNALTEQERAEGDGAVPVAAFRWATEELEGGESDESGAAAMADLLGKLGLSRDSNDTAGQAFLQGEGSRCRSNRDESAADFIGQLLDTAGLSATERQSLARARLQLLDACTWEADKQASLLPPDVQSSEAKAFVAYLRAASDFYSGRFSDAETGFNTLAESTQPWLKETALYMVARTRLNAAQQDAFDEYGSLKEDHDRTAYAGVGQAIERYLSAYPDGRYSRSATGLLRRVHWLAGDTDKLAADYAWQLTEAGDARASAPPEALIQEADNKLLTALTGATPSPLMTATHDLMIMRPHLPNRLTREQLDGQKALFAAQPAMFDYLQAAFAFYVDKNPAEALKRLPNDVPEKLDYLAFSQQTLRGLALEDGNDLPAAQALWLKLLPLAQQPLQREQLELALAMNYERSGQLTKVFASDSPITSAQVRLILLGRWPMRPCCASRSVRASATPKSPPRNSSCSTRSCCTASTPRSPMM